VEESASLSLLYPLILNDEVEELPATGIFHDQVEVSKDATEDKIKKASKYFG
jgi:hypothetical protein